MTEFGGLVLFGVVAALITCFAIGLCYCGFVLLCTRKREQALADNEILV